MPEALLYKAIYPAIVNLQKGLEVGGWSVSGVSVLFYVTLFFFFVTVRINLLCADGNLVP